MKNLLLFTTHANRLNLRIGYLAIMLLISVNAWAIPPVITTQPSNMTVCVGTNTTFSIVASNTTSYQWQVNTGGGFVNVTNGGVYSNATTNVLTITGATAAMSGYLYRCIATGPDNPPATSNSVSLTVNTPGVITVQPTATTTICSGGNASLTVTATGTISGYQWYGYNGVSYVALTNGGIYSGVTTSTLNITGITASPNTLTYSYFCGVSSPCGGGSTNPSYLTVNALPAISTQPVNDTACSGNVASFLVNTTGQGLTYQWQLSNTNGVSWINVTNNATYSNATTAQLEIVTNPFLTDLLYRCIVSGTCTPSVTSNSGRLTVDQFVAVTTHPTSQQVCPGGNTSFNVFVTGTGPTFQWQVNTGGGWVNVTNGGVYAGATTNTLTLTNVPLSFNNNFYRCVVNGKCTGSAVSNVANLTVPTTAAITSQPAAATTICSGGNTSLTVGATGSGLTYQWYGYNGVSYVALANGGIYSGVTTATLNITGITSAPNTQTFSYFCAVTGTCGGGATVPSYVTVNALPDITVHPKNDTACPGNIAYFEVTATGEGLTFQWQVSHTNGLTWVNLSNDAIYSRVTQSGMEVITQSYHANNRYRCIVSGTCAPPDTSNSATFIVDQVVAINTQPNPRTACPGTNTNFSVFVTGTEPTFQWQINTGGGWVNVTNGGVYSGATTNTLTLTNVTLPLNNNQYRCVVNGKCTGSAVSNAVTLTVPTPVSINTQPAAAATICSGGNASFTVSATGSGLTYQWFGYNGVSYVAIANGGIYSGVNTATLNITGITSAPNAQTFSYFCAVSGSCGGGATVPSYLTVNALPNVSDDPDNDTVCAGSAAYFEIVANGTNPTYQWQVSANNGTSWSNLSNSAIYSNVTTSGMIVNTNASLNNNLYRCIVSGICTPPDTSVGARLVVNTAPVVTVHPTSATICSGTNGSFSVTATGAGLTYQWQVFNGSVWSNITNTGIYSNATTATLNLTGATTAVHLFKYRCAINGTCAPGTISNDATLNINTAPAVTAHPSNIAVCPGGNTSFSVTATGAGLTYQWEVNNGTGWIALTNGGIYSNVTSATLNLTGATIAVNGFMYRCVVSGTCVPSATTNAATLTINGVPAITGHPVNTTVCLNNNTSFNVTATGTGLTYQWQTSVNGTTWSTLSNNSVYSNVTTATLNITSAQASINGLMYRCIVSGTCTPAATSNAATLTVNMPTAISSNPGNVTICQGANASFSVTASGSGLAYQWQVNTGTGFVNVTNGGVYSGATSNMLSLTNVAPSFNTYQYRCMVTGLCAPLSLTSTNATLTVNTNVVINTQPASGTTICSGDNMSLTVAATGTGITYQWYVHNGTIYVPVTNAGIYSGATTATLNITGITAAPSAKTYIYYCSITGTCGQATTNQSYVNVNAKPAVTSNPANVTVCDSSNNISFNVTATGTSLTYQWQVNTGSSWVNLSNNTITSGVNTSQLLLIKVFASMNSYQYRCVVSGACTPSATSGNATLTVNPLVTPSVTIAANNNNICAGTLVTFTATPVNGGVSPNYQWKVNGVNAGGNSAIFATSSLSHLNVVTCQMTSNQTCPSPQSVFSNPITMVVVSYQTPTVVITSSSGNTECSGIPVTFTTATTFAGTAPAYQWQVNGVNVGSVASSYVTDSLDNGDVVRCIMTSDFMCPAPQVVSSNNISMTINQTTPATVSIRTNPDTTVCRGKEVILYAYYTNSGINPQFQWIKNGGNIAGETGATYTTTTLSNNDVIKCRFISSALCVFPVESDTLKFKVNNPVIPDVTVKVSFNGVNSYTFTATPINGGTNPTYTWFVNGTAVGGVTGPTYTTSLLTPAASVYVTMTSNHTCITTDVANSRIVTTGIGGQEEVISDLKLYPNPNTGRFTISGEYAGIGTQNARVTIMNALGQLIYTSDVKVVSGKINHEINLDNEPASGMYMMRIDMEGKQDIRRFNIAR